MTGDRGERKVGCEIEILFYLLHFTISYCYNLLENWEHALVLNFNILSKFNWKF